MASQNRRARHPGKKAAAAGAVLAHILPLGFYLPTQSRAAWCWNAPPAQCSAPVVEGGSCAEGDTIPHGGVCTAQCSDGKVPLGTCQVQCPPSTDSGGCSGDITALPSGENWWDVCGGGSECSGEIAMGTAPYLSFGSFTCVDPENATNATSCESLEIVTAPKQEEKHWDWAVVGLLLSFAGVMAVGTVVARLPSKDSHATLFRDLLPGLNAGNLLALSAVLIGLAVFLGVLVDGASDVEKVFVSGLAAGCASLLPIVLAIWTVRGVHGIMAMGRERAWQMHSAVSLLSLIFGTVHGVWAMNFIEEPLGRSYWVLGLVALLLMWLGALPAVVYSLAPRIFTYDMFKLVHILAPLGYVFAIIHMLDHALVLDTTEGTIVAWTNIVAFFWLMLERVMVGLLGVQGTDVSGELLSDEGGCRHLVLSLQAEGVMRRYRPGQWGHVTALAAGAVPHPFTIIPGENNSAKFIIKVSGKFTANLAEALQNSGRPDVKIEGPYGEPPIPSKVADAVVFVVGGVGVTPALSLVPAARQSGIAANRVYFYWSTRSPALLQHCAPLLEPHLDAACTCVRVTGASTEGALPLGAQEGRLDLRGWLGEAASALSSTGAKSALLFICGPPGLAAAAWSGARSKSITWIPHEEQFNFLAKPLDVAGGQKATKKAASGTRVEPSTVGIPDEPRAPN